MSAAWRRNSPLHQNELTQAISMSSTRVTYIRFPSKPFPHQRHASLTADVESWRWAGHAPIADDVQFLSVATCSKYCQCVKDLLASYITLRLRRLLSLYYLLARCFGQTRCCFKVSSTCSHWHLNVKLLQFPASACQCATRAVPVVPTWGSNVAQLRV